MLCTWHRWRISQAFDTDSPLPRPVEHHLRGCLRCREYHDFAVTLKNQSKKDLDLLGDRDTQALTGSVMKQLKAQKTRLPDQRPNFPWIPVSAAAAGLAALVLTLVLVLPSREGGLTALNPLSEWGTANSTLTTALEKVDSPYKTEFENLKSSLTAAANFFQNFMDIRVGDGE